MTRGQVVRGYLGVRMQERARPLADALRIETTAGILVADVSPGSPAAKAGLKRGDVILSFNGHAVQDPGQLRNTVAMTAPGTKATMQILRDNKKRELTVELGELPREQTTRANEEETPAPARVGFSVQNVPPDVARQLGYDNPEGVIVTQIDPNSEAYQAGVRRGMLIRQVNRQDVNNTQEFRQALAKAEPTKRVLLLVQDQQATRYITFPLG